MLWLYDWLEHIGDVELTTFCETTCILEKGIDTSAEIFPDDDVNAEEMDTFLLGDTETPILGAGGANGGSTSSAAGATSASGGGTSEIIAGRGRTTSGGSAGSSGSSERSHISGGSHGSSGDESGSKAVGIIYRRATLSVGTFMKCKLTQGNVNCQSSF